MCGAGGRGVEASDLCSLIHHSGRAILDTSLSDGFMPQKAANGARPECDGGLGVAQPAASSVSADAQTAQRTGAHCVAQDWLLSASLPSIRGAFRPAGYTRVTRIFMPRPGAGPLRYTRAAIIPTSVWYLQRSWRKAPLEQWDIVRLGHTRSEELS